MMSFHDGSSPMRIPSSPLDPPTPNLDSPTPNLDPAPDCHIVTSPESDSTFGAEFSPFGGSASSNLGFSPFGRHLSSESEFRVVKRRKLSFSNEADSVENKDDLMNTEDDSSEPGCPGRLLPEVNSQGNPGPPLPQPDSNNDVQNLSSDDESYTPQYYREDLEEDSNSTGSINIDSDEGGDSEKGGDSDVESDGSGLISDDRIFESDLLYENSSVTAEEVVVDLCNIYIKNRLTKTALADMVKFVTKILLEVNGMPHNLKELFNLVKQRAPPVPEVAHMYCPQCLEVKISKDDQCITEACSGKGGNFFYEFSLDQQLIFLFEKGGLAEAVEQFHHSRMAKEGIISDICDGSEAKNLKKIHNEMYDITLLWNTDGVSLDTDYHLWPVLFTICEIPVRLRAYYIWVSLVWYDLKEPPMKTLLKPFVKSLVDINNQGGLSWTHPKTGQKIKSQVAAPAAVADAPARSKLQETKQYNGINGCNTCEITCTPVLVKGKTRYFYVFNEDPARLRTERRMLKQARHALDVPGGSVMGVKGISAVNSVPHLDISKFVFPEYMHSVLLGCVLSFTQLLINIDAEWRLKKKLKEIDETMLSLRVPDFLKIPQRLSRVTIKPRVSDKAHKLRAWLLYFSLPILSSYLPQKYLQHWMLLVGSICLLLQEKISESDLLSAEIMLRMFVRGVGKLYDVTAYKYNTHQLSHLVLMVRRWGPLWANSAFMFENFNGVITRMIHGKKHIAKEIVENLKIAAGLMVLKSAVGSNASPCTKVLGRDVENVFSESELCKIAEISSAPFKTYLRAQVGKTVYTSRQYDDHVKRCNSFVTVQSENTDEIAQIVCFLKFPPSEEIWCEVEMYDVDHPRFFVHKATRFLVNHIVPLKESPRERSFVPIVKLKQKLVRVQNFVCISPNSYEINL